jgi:hypothetical protein
MKRVVLAVAVLAACAAAAVGAVAATSGGAGGAGCRFAAGWQALANRIHAPVYCPTWLPDPLDGHIGGQWNNIDSVARDRSYLIGFVWQEVGSGELHVNLRGYPGRTTIPTCRVAPDAGQPARTTPCFAEPHGHKTVGDIHATLYTVNQDADTWHLLYAWRHDGSLYTISQHVAAPLTYDKVLADLDRELHALVLVRPKG